MSAKLIKFSYPVPSNKNGQAFSSTEEQLAKLGGESAGQFLVGSQGMWHGGIHFTDATIPWCALSTESAAEQEYLRESYKGEQFIRCMADGEIVAYRVCKDYESTAIDWRDDKVNFSTSFVLVKHYIQPGENSDSGLTFYTLYMNLAPFSAYATQDNERVRKAKGQKYYLTPENVTSGTEGSSLAAGTLVTLGDKIMTRSRDKHQFSLVTLADGKEVWTASDQGFLTPVSTSSGAMAPPWWSGCSPAYSTLPASLTVMKTTDTLRSYLSQEDVLAGTESVSLPAGTVVKVEQQNALHQMTKGSDTDARKFSLVTLTTDVKKPKRMRGDRVWVLSDNNNLIAAGGEASGSPTFNEVVSDVGIKVKAGDGLGHMGFYQLPEENGKSSRYQVHIECLSMDPLDTFITNPAQVGVQEPTFVKYPAGATLLTKNAQGQMVDSTRKTKTQGIAAHSAVPVENVDGNAAYYQIHGENGWVAAADIQLIPQYALADRGFVTLNKSGASFDLINGTLQPDNIVKDILEQLLTAAQAETRPAYALNQYNYQRLLEQIDSNNDGHYSIEEYLQALQSVSYRDRLHHIIAKHASEWYYGKGDPLWATYLETLTNDAPQWKTYLETFIDKMTWMKNVNGLGPDPWHMHPVVFLDALNIVSADIITLEMVLAANLGQDKVQCERILSYINNYARTYNVTDKKEIAHFLSQVGHESQFRIVEENLSFSPKRMREMYGCKGGHEKYVKSTDTCSLGKLRDKLWTQESYYARNSEHLGNYVYEKRMGNGPESSGDGYKYRGRGMIQLTGKDAYQSFTNTHNQMNSSDIKDFVNNPDLITSRLEYGVESAFSFWVKKTNRAGEHLNTIAKSGSVSDVTQMVNGGANGYDDRKKRYNNVAPLLGLSLES
ncbi:hypothetical protein LVQ78_22330 [Buttiauxella sp. A2-C2_NF]|uniref:glycoside hydrolase family 19 protein n=1 Tax=Buttiauxella ferragutiae TaxID=82989 RepID=UPI001E366FD3|nr:hypothetical protein [Buttiauxella ferragutiae]MCE0828746.1 hypothetical protein [Buttiauxella ferragutiae]